MKWLVTCYDAAAVTHPAITTTRRPRRFSISGSRKSMIFGYAQVQVLY